MGRSIRRIVPSRPVAEWPPLPGPADLDQHGIGLTTGDDALAVELPEDVAVLTVGDFDMPGIT